MTDDWERSEWGLTRVGRLLHRMHLITNYRRGGVVRLTVLWGIDSHKVDRVLEPLCSRWAIAVMAFGVVLAVGGRLW